MKRRVVIISPSSVQPVSLFKMLTCRQKLIGLLESHMQE